MQSTARASLYLGNSHQSLFSLPWRLEVGGWRLGDLESWDRKADERERFILHQARPTSALMPAEASHFNARSAA
ncbi:hypothetical protein E4U37_001709 [Claviceps purpurea]|nr:hypothetical protein E4U37_001709 [Claviceps purpurea]